VEWVGDNGISMFVQIRNLKKYFAIEAGIFSRAQRQIKAVDGVSFDIRENESLGLVGESGCGKTTLAKLLLKIILPTSGEVIFNSGKITNLRKDVQIVFQNPLGSLNPLMKIRDILAEPLLIHRIVPKKYLLGEMKKLLKSVQMQEEALSRYPDEFSQGQRQRICIARSLASQPKLLVLDEPLSALDLTIQKQILSLLLDLRKKFSLSYFFISHNIALVRRISDRILVMHKGKIIEEGSTDKIITNPQHPYTQNLIKAVRFRESS